MDEGRGVLAHPVVRTAPRGEVELTGLAGNAFLSESREQREDRFGRQSSPEELGLEHWLLVLRARLLPVLNRSIGRVEGRPKLHGLLAGHVLANLCRRIGAGPGDQLVEESSSVSFRAEH